MLYLLLSGSLTQAIRNFAKSLENWLKGAMVGVPEDMLKCKVGICIKYWEYFKCYYLKALIAI